MIKLKSKKLLTSA